MLKTDSELEIFDLTGRQSLEPRLILNISSVRQYWRYLKILTWIYLTSQAVLERQVGERRRWKEELEKSRIEMEHQVDRDDNQTKHKRIQTTQTYKNRVGG